MSTMTAEKQTEITKSIIDQYLDDMDKGHDETNTVRQKLRNKLVDRVLKIADGEAIISDAETTMAELAMFKTAMDVLNDEDKNRTNKVTTRLKKKDTDTRSDLVSKIATEALRTTPINKAMEAMKAATGAMVIEENDAVISRQISEAFRETGIVISENELLDDYKLDPKQMLNTSEENE